MARPAGNEGDPLKMYTLVMTLLVVVMAVLYFVIDGQREEYAAANVRAERYMTGKGLCLGPGELGEPRTVPDLAVQIERLSKAYAQASGGTGPLTGIPQAMMTQAATAAGLKQVYGSAEREQKNRAGRGGGYRTVTQNFEYEDESGGPPPLWKLLELLYRIESRGRFRVSEVSWTIADEAENSQEPYARVKQPRITVALRGPLLSE